jgi:glycosyltransferase involved in cell wall biosynthesis
MPEPRVAIAYDCLYPVQHGGGERVYRRMAELFVDRGSAVTYVTRAAWSPDAPPSAPFDIVSVWRGEIYDAAGTRTTGSAVAFASGLFRYFIRHRRDYDVVVVSALPVLNVFAVWLALAGSGARLVVDWLEVWPARTWRAYAGRLRGTVAWVLQRMAVGIGDVVTVNSGFTRDRFRRYRGGADPIVLGLVDLVGEDSGAALVAPTHPSLLFVGRHIADKRLDVLPAALAVARRHVPQLRLRVAGSGPETSRLLAAAESAGVSDAVELLGRVDDETLSRLFRDASVLVNPSRREGFGLVIAEAAAAGTPSVVVAGDDNAAADLVHDGVNGEVAASADAAVLGSAIVRVVEAGDVLRASTLEWFRNERADRGLARSVDVIRERVTSPA